MLRKFIMLCTAISLSLVFATAVQAKTFSLISGGGQVHIGNGLMLPIQAAATAATTGTMFPTLLIPVKGIPQVEGTTSKALISTMGKKGYQRDLTVPPTALSKAAGQVTVGVKFSNPSAFAVGTNLNYKWPVASAVFKQGPASGLASHAGAPKTVAGFGGTMTYTNALGRRFGGPASFSLAPGAAAGLIGTAPVTVYIKINATTPPCVHTAVGGADPSCLAGLLVARPTGVAAVGGATAATVTTPGTAPTGMNVAAVNLGTMPLGTVNAAVRVASAALPTNMASSQPGPWTSGKIIISNPAAAGAPEVFTLSGKDDRTALGGGTIQLVSGALSTRTATGANANRGWLRLTFQEIGVPALSPLAQAAVVSLVLLAGVYTLRRLRFSSHQA